MKKFLIAVAVLFALLLVGVGVAAFTLDSKYELDNSITIHAPPEKVHVLVGHLDRWPEWTPWNEMDPTMKVTAGALSTGVGASQAWTGDGGNGDLTFTACDPKTGIAYEMAFVEGETRMPSTCTMTYTPEGGSTVVHWTMSGDLGDSMPGPMASLARPFIELAISEAFDKGLVKLKTAVEGQG